MVLRKFFVFLWCFLFILQSSFCEESEFLESSTEIQSEIESEEKSSFLHENDGKKHYFTAIGGLLFWNVGLMTYNRYAIGASWAQVGWDEWGSFWKRKLEWDNDWYWTNFVLHPYQGTIYYNVARGSNLNRIESFGLTVLGSAMWEYFCETNAPSKNDMIYTTVGAFSMGEMLYRLSLEADEIHDALGILVNPTRMWTELWTRQKPLGTHGNIDELSLRFSVGSVATQTNLAGYVGDYPQNEIFPVFASPELNIVYKNPFGHDSNDPYSQFELNLGGSVGKGSGYGAQCAYPETDKSLFYQIRIISNGMLISRAPEKWNTLDTQTTVGAVMEYDFDWHSFYLLSSLAPGFAIKQRREFEKIDFEWQAHLAAILLGTSDFYYYHRDFDQTFVEGRNGSGRSYNYTIGAQTKLNAKIKTKDGSSIFADFRGYAMYDFENQLQQFVNGENATQTGWDFIGDFSFGAEYALTKIVRLGASDEIYAKFATYKSLNDVSQVVNTVRVYGKLQLK